MIRRPPRSTPLYSPAASDVYKRQLPRLRRPVHLRLPPRETDRARGRPERGDHADAKGARRDPDRGRADDGAVPQEDDGQLRLRRGEALDELPRKEQALKMGFLDSFKKMFSSQEQDDRVSLSRKVQASPNDPQARQKLGIFQMQQGEVVEGLDQLA